MPYSIQANTQMSSFNAYPLCFFPKKEEIQIPIIIEEPKKEPLVIKTETTISLQKKEEKKPIIVEKTQPDFDDLSIFDTIFEEELGTTSIKPIEIKQEETPLEKKLKKLHQQLKNEGLEAFSKWIDYIKEQDIQNAEERVQRILAFNQQLKNLLPDNPDLIVNLVAMDQEYGLSKSELFQKHVLAQLQNKITDLEIIHKTFLETLKETAEKTKEVATEIIAKEPEKPVEESFSYGAILLAPFEVIKTVNDIFTGDWTFGGG